MTGFVVIEWTQRGGAGCRLTIHPTRGDAEQEAVWARERAKGWGFAYTVAKVEEVA